MLGCSTKAGAYVAKQCYLIGYEIIVYDWMNLPNQNSKYVSKYINVASPETNLSKFNKEFLCYLSANDILAVLPLHDAALEIVRFLKNLIPSKISILGLNHDSVYQYAHNKWELIKRAQKFNLTVPKSILIEKLEDFKSDLSLTFPIVVKPVSSARIINGKLITFKVSVANDHEALYDIVREVINNSPIMLQEFIEGYGIGFNFTSENGLVNDSYIHKRINESNGVSSFRESIADSEYGLKDNVFQFIKDINWTGVGMLEFKVDNNHAVLMELNGRFFGSIELGIKSGFNFPKQYLNLYLENKPLKKSKSVRLNTRVRNLHDELLLNIYSFVRGKFITFLKWKLSIFISFFKKNEFIEDNVFGDSKFVFSLYFWDLKRILNKVQTRIQFKLFKHQILNRAILVNKNLTIAFVCKGNICRSPFAENYAKSINSSHKFLSFGTVSTENRLSPINALKAAKIYKIELEAHSSQYLRIENIGQIDVFVVMDKSNYFDLSKMGVPKNKIYMLDKNEITDPYRKDLNQFISVYNNIKSCIDKNFTNEKAA
jgi:protein-tyrosine-phosphatase/predicted ATP-grasp superfamily ATP-dependent carboligase